MPANLTPQYHEAERRYKEARTSAEKQKALRGMLAIIPKHKGTEKIVADLRRKLSKLQEEIEAERRHKSGGPSPGHVKSEGAGQVVLLGAANAGKSSLLGALTHAHPKIAPYPFTTREPQAGMMDFEDTQVQLVDTPAVSAEFMEPWMGELLRHADRTLLVCDLASDSVLDDLEVLVRRLAERQVRLRPPAPPDPEAAPAVAASGADAGHGAPPAFESPAAARDQTDTRLASVETLVAANKADAAGAAERLLLLHEVLHQALGVGEEDVVAVSAQTGAGLETLRRALFASLRVIRVYTKMPGRKPEQERPFVLPRGATVIDLARVIHRDMAESLQFARLWGSSRFDGQTVQRDQELQDGDVVELHV